MGEVTNFFTEFSEQRRAKRVELEAAGIPEKEIREAVHLIHPFAAISAAQQADDLAKEEDSAQQADDIDFKFDQKDVSGPEWLAEHPGYKGD